MEITTTKLLLPDQLTPFRKLIIQYDHREETFHLSPNTKEFKALISSDVVAIKLLDIGVDGVPVEVRELL